MGHSCLELRGKHVIQHDFEIMTVVASTAKYVLEHTEDREALPDYVRIWKRDLVNHIHGGVDLQLDRFLLTDEDIQNLILSIKAAKSAFLGDKDFISQEHFQLWVSDDLIFKDGGIEAKIVAPYFDKIILFLSKTLKGTPEMK